MRRRSSAAFAVALVTVGCGASTGPSAPATPTPSPAAPEFTMLRASGRQIVNETGQAVRLRGLNLGGWLVKEGYILHFPGPSLDSPSEIDRAIVDLAGAELGPVLLDEWREQWIAEADLTEIHALGFDSVRLPLHYALLWDVGSGAPRPEGFAFLDRVVDWCERQRLWLFLDLHCAPGGQNAANISDSDGVARLYTDPADEDATAALWEEIAARYRDRVAVGGYDLLNEPVFDRGPDVARLFERLTRAIRRVDGRHLVLVEGNTWATDFSIFGAPFDGNLAYSFHKYWNATDEASIQPFLDFSGRWNVPLWLGETGENSNAWYQQALDLVDRHEIGWCFWTWKKIQTDNGPLSVEPPAGTWSRITDYFDGKGPRPTPDEAAAAVRAMLQAAQVSRCRRNDEVIRILQAY
ncbi:MAG TPA: cellulase family glycosylhydrolase [Vicinamibacteria bacterium]|nr:cellulase family glycosylhydrolase [Vicinamibacteria bacterium]